MPCATEPLHRFHTHCLMESKKGTMVAWSAQTVVQGCRAHANMAAGRSQSVAEKKKEVADDDVLALLGDEVHQAAKAWQLTSLQVRYSHVPCMQAALAP